MGTFIPVQWVTAVTSTLKDRGMEGTISYLAEEDKQCRSGVVYTSESSRVGSNVLQYVSTAQPLTRKTSTCFRCLFHTYSQQARSKGRPPKVHCYEIALLLLSGALAGGKHGAAMRLGLTEGAHVINAPNVEYTELLL